MANPIDIGQGIDLTALREELSSDLLDVEKAKTEFLEQQNVTGFRAEIARGFADAFSDDFEVDPMEVVEKTQGNIAELGDDKEDLLDTLLGGETNEKDWWDWKDPADALGHLALSIFGAVYSKFEGTFVGDWLENTMEKMSGISEKREAIFSNLRNPGVILGSLKHKLERAEAVGLPLQNDQMNLGVVTGLIGFLNSNEELLKKYEDLDASDPSAVANWWEEALRAFSAEPGNADIDVDSQFVQDAIAVLVGEKSWSEVLIDGDLDQFGREVEAGEVEDIENRDYGEMVPLAESEVNFAGQAIFGRIQSFVKDNGPALSVISVTAVPMDSAAKGLISMDSAAFSEPTSETYKMLADLPFDAQEDLPLSEVFETMALFEQMAENGEEVMIPKEASQFIQYLKDKARQAGPEFSHLAHSTEIDRIASIFTSPTEGLQDKIVAGTTTIFGNICTFALEILGDSEAEFLQGENRAGIGRLDGLLQERVTSQNAQKINHVRKELLPRFRRSGHISFEEISAELNPTLESLGLRLYRDGRGYIWFQESIEGSDKWKNVKKIMVDADHPKAEDRAKELTESGNFAFAAFEGLMESSELGIGNIREKVTQGHWFISGAEGVGLFITEATTGAVLKVLPFHFISQIPEIFEKEDGLTAADIGVTVGNTMTTFIVLGAASGISEGLQGKGFSKLLPWNLFGKALGDTFEGMEVMRQAAFVPDKFRTNMSSRYNLYRSRFVHGMRSVYSLDHRRLHRYNLAKYELQQAKVALMPKNRLREFARLMTGDSKTPEFAHGGRQITIDAKRIDDLIDALDSKIRAEGGRVVAPRVNGRMPKVKGRGIGRGILVLGALAMGGAAGQELWSESSKDTSRGPESKTKAEERDITLPEKREVHRNVTGGAITGDTNEYEGIWNLFRQPDLKNLDPKEYRAAVDGSIANHEQLVSHLQNEITENRELYFNYVLEQPGETVEVAVPHDLPGQKGFIRLKIKDGKLVMHYADKGDLKRSFYEDVDAPETLAGTAGDLALRVAPVTGTFMDGKDAWKAAWRGDMKGFARSAAWTVVGGISDVLLIGGGIASFFGVGIPFAWAGGAIRGARAAKIATVATRHSGKVFAVMTGAELWHSVDRSMFDGDLTHIHTF